jgi:Sigma-54, DNA binding domain
MGELDEQDFEEFPADSGLSPLSRAEMAIRSERHADLELASNLLDDINRHPNGLHNHLDRCRYTMARAIVFSRQGKNEHAAAHARLALHFASSLASLPEQWTAQTRESWRWEICRRHLHEMDSLSKLAPDFVFLKEGSQFVVRRIEELHDDLRLDRCFAERFGKVRPSCGTQVCSLLLRYQQEFLENGPDHLRPLTMKQVAEEIGTSPSTVCKFVGRTTAQTPHGRFDLRFFFQPAANVVADERWTRVAVQSMVKQAIVAEDPQEPVTDQNIEALLRAKGIVVSRRTIAKYRDAMKIPSTRVRRSLPDIQSMVQQIIARENPLQPATDQQIEALLNAEGIAVSNRTIAQCRKVMKIPSVHFRHSRD